MSTVGFLGGAMFNHYVAFPFMMRFFGSFNGDDLLFLPRVQPVFSLYTKLLIAMGLVFQMPTVVFFLAKMKVVTARFLVRHIKYAILMIFVISARRHPDRRPVDPDGFRGADDSCSTSSASSSPGLSVRSRRLIRKSERGSCQLTGGIPVNQLIDLEYTSAVLYVRG